MLKFSESLIVNFLMLSKLFNLEEKKFFECRKVIFFIFRSNLNFILVNIFYMFIQQRKRLQLVT